MIPIFMGQVYNEPQETLGGWFYFLLMITILNTIGEIYFIILFINSSFPMMSYITIAINIIFWGIFGYLKYTKKITYKVMFISIFLCLLLCTLILGKVYDKEIAKVYLEKPSSWLGQLNKVKVKK